MRSVISQNCRGSPQARQRRSRRIGRSLGDSGQGAPYRRHCIRCDQALVCIGELRLPNPAATLATKLAGPAAGQPQASRRLAISTPYEVAQFGQTISIGVSASAKSGPVDPNSRLLKKG